MLTINVRVPADRNETAVVEIFSGASRIAGSLAAASASAELARSHGNADCDPLRPWGHPPLGNYRLIAHGPAPAGCDLEYGKHLLVFQPESGNALDAESFGRLLLLAYAGPAGKGGRMRRTQGGLRFRQETLEVLLARLESDPAALLQIDLLDPPAWWQFWKRAQRTLALASEPPRLSAPPLDEASLAEQLSAGKPLARRTPLRAVDDNIDSRSDYDHSRSTSSQTDSPYTGRGGEYAGAGASGSWDAPSSSGAGRGVDAAGRITAFAAGAAMLAESVSAAEREVTSSDAGENESGRGSGNDTRAETAAEPGTETATGY